MCADSEIVPISKAKVRLLNTILNFSSEIVGVICENQFYF